MNNTGIFFDVEGATPLNLPAESGEIDAHQEGTSTLTETTATSILSFPIADTTTLAGTVVLVTECDDTTDRLVQHETYDFVCINEADTETCGFSTSLGAGVVAATAGTMSGHTLAYTGGTNAVTFTLNATCSLTQTLLESRWEIEFHHPTWAVVTEQN